MICCSVTVVERMLRLGSMMQHDEHTICIHLQTRAAGWHLCDIKWASEPSRCINTKEKDSKAIEAEKKEQYAAFIIAPW